MVVMTSREFRENTSVAEQAAKDGPVIITDHGEPAYVLMTMADFMGRSGEGAAYGFADVATSNREIAAPSKQENSPARRSLIDILSYPEVADIDLQLPERTIDDWRRRTPDLSDD